VAKILIIAVLAVLVWWMVTGRWPWQAKPTRLQRQTDRARKLLSVPAKATRTDIQAAHRRLIATVHPDRGGSTAMVHRANEARDLLIAQLPVKHRIPSSKEDQ